MDFKETLRLLQIKARDFETVTTRHGKQFSSVKLPQLEELIRKLEIGPKPRKVQCPEEYLELWSSIPPGHPISLPTRAIRFLCWEPSVSITARFLEYLRTTEVAEKASPIQGLVYSQHSRWLEAQPTGTGQKYVRPILTNYKGRNRLLRKWQSKNDLILANDAHLLAGAEIYRTREDVSGFCANWGLNEQTEFIQQAASAAFSFSLERLDGAGSEGGILDFLLGNLLPWKNWSLENYRKLVARAIMTNQFQSNEEFQNKLLEVVVGDARLGDPRLPRNIANWVGIPVEARDRVLRILSRSDIIFFFERVMTYDRHGRKNFWLDYVPNLKQSRPLLTDNDRIRLNSILSRQGNKTLHYGRTRGQHSAFLLDFGNLIVVEFNEVGACFQYEDRYRRTFFPHFYTDDDYNDAMLKKPEFTVERVTHRGDWEWRMRGLLARFGIRPQ